MASPSAPQTWADRLGPQLLLIWAGISIGVAFLATPAKFLAPSLSLPVALDVGRHTFRVYSQTELILLAALVVLGLWARRRRAWYLSLVIPGLVVFTQVFWLFPALEFRVSAIEAGNAHLPPSSLHLIYIAAESLKLLWLLAFGFGRPGLVQGGR
jgi:hypothetical protein